MELPLQKGEQKYETGLLTTTVINLLDWEEGEDSPLRYSDGWRHWTIQEEGAIAGVTVNGVALSEDLDVVVYVKGDKKPVFLYSVNLYVDYE